MSRRSGRHSGELAGIASVALGLETSHANSSQKNKHFEPNHHNINASGAQHTEVENSANCDSILPTIERPGSASSQQNSLDEDEEDDGSKKKAVTAPFGLPCEDQAGHTAFYSGDDNNNNNNNKNNTTLQGIQAASRIPDFLSPADEANQESDDGVYNAVEFISESEDIEMHEEDAIINDFEDEYHTQHDFTDIDIDGKNMLLSEDFPLLEELPRVGAGETIMGGVFSQESVSALDADDSPLYSQSHPCISNSRKVHFDDHMAQTIDFDIAFKDNPFPGGFTYAVDEDDDCSSVGMSGYETDGERTDEEPVPNCVTKSPRDLLHRPSWNEEPLKSPTPLKRSKKEGRKLKLHWGPRLGSFQVDPNKALAQTDELGRCIIIHPKKESTSRAVTLAFHPDSASTSRTTALLSPLQNHAATTEVQLSGEFGADQVCFTDPTISNGTDAAMTGMLENMLGDDNQLEFYSLPSDFIPATSVLDEIRFTRGAAPTSDQESEDIEDIGNILNFTDNSSDSDNAAQCLKLRESPSTDDTMDIGRETKHTAGSLMTPESSQSRRPAIPLDDSMKKQDIVNGNTALRGGGVPSKTPPVRRPRSGLALTRPSTRVTNGQPNRKRKMSDTFTPSSRPITRARR